MKLCTCQIGLKRLNEGNHFVAFEIEDEDELTRDDVVIIVSEDDVIEKITKGIFTVLNKKPIQVV